MISNRCSGFPQGNDFGMGGGIAIGEVAIETAANNLSLVDNHRTDWHLAGF